MHSSVYLHARRIGSSNIAQINRVKSLRPRTDRIRRLLWIVTFCKEEPALRKLCFWAQGFGTVAHPSLFVRYEERGGYRLHVDRIVKKGTTLLSVPLPMKSRNKTIVTVNENDVAPEDRQEFKDDSSPVVQAHSSGPLVSADVTQLVQSLTRGLHDRNHPQHDYLRFLHDHYNPIENDTDTDNNDATTGLTPPPWVETTSAFKPWEESLNTSAALQMFSDADAYADGTAMVMKGVPNAPYLKQSDFSTSRARGEMVRLERMIRDLQQGLPYFATPAVRWALSMVMSRSLALPEASSYISPKQQLTVPYPFEHLQDQVDSTTLRHLYSTFTLNQTLGHRLSVAQSEDNHLSMVPLLDFCNHSDDPTAHYCVTFPGSMEHAIRRDRLEARRVNKVTRKRKADKENPMLGNTIKRCSHRMLSPVVGVRGWRYWQPCVHLVAVKDIEKYGEVTIKYADVGLNEGDKKSEKSKGIRKSSFVAAEDTPICEGFRFRYGFMPSSTKHRVRPVPSLKCVATSLEKLLENRKVTAVK